MLGEGDPDDIDLGPNLTRGLVDRIGRAIVVGECERSDLATEARIGRLNNVSRSVTREAVKMLASKGLLASRPREGTTVQPTDKWNLLDPDILRWMRELELPHDVLLHLTRLRLAIEPEAAALAARYADENDRQRIMAAVKRMKRAREENNETTEIDLRFHLAILHATRNPFFVRLQPLLQTALRSTIRLIEKARGNSPSIKGHETVARLIVTGEPTAAKAAMSNIVQEAINVLEQRGLVTKALSDDLVQLEEA